MILPPDLHAWPCISSLRGPSRRRPPTWNPANAILCPLEAYLFMFASPIFFSSLTKRPRVVVCCLGPPKWSWHCWVPDSGLSCPFQASGNCLTAMLGSDAGGREAGHGSWSRPDAGFLSGLGLFRMRRIDAGHRMELNWMTVRGSIVVVANTRPNALCRALWRFLSRAGPIARRIRAPTSNPQLPPPTARSRSNNSALRPWNLDRSDAHQSIDQLALIVKNGISHINGILAISGRHVLESEGVGLKLLKGALWSGANQH